MRSSLSSYWLICGIVLTSPSEIGVGFCHEASPCIGMPGWKKGSWAYHGDDGKFFLEEDQGAQFGGTYGVGDVIGCGSDRDKDEFFFTKNGRRVGELLYCCLVYKPDIDRSRVCRGITSWKAVCSGWCWLQKLPFLSKLWP